ncbi:hypothetical protein AAMO2058_001600400 [Amorphochlora amoebiformis]|eukprot:1346928-Amorphochlora_amoeboformis.AAC.1
MARKRSGRQKPTCAKRRRTPASNIDRRPRREIVESSLHCLLGTEIIKLIIQYDYKSSCTMGRAGLIHSICFSPDGNLLATGSSGCIKIWSVLDGTEKVKLIGHKNSVHTLRFSNDGKYLVSMSIDQTIKIWSMEDKRLLKSMDIDGKPVGILGNLFRYYCCQVVRMIANFDRLHSIGDGVIAAIREQVGPMLQSIRTIVRRASKRIGPVEILPFSLESTSMNMAAAAIATSGKVFIFEKKVAQSFSVSSMVPSLNLFTFLVSIRRLHSREY